MTAGERVRWLAAVGGCGLWLAIPAIVLEGGVAKYRHRCRGRTYTGEWDDCFNDYLPVLEVVVVPALIILSAYLAARFAFTLYAPPPARRTRRWRLAARDGAIASWPVFAVLAAIGLAWTIWRLTTYAFVPALLPFQLYWGCFAAWFAAGILVGVKDRRAEQRAD